MFQSKPVVFFLLKAILIYGLLSFPPLSFDTSYANFYRSINNFYFKTICKTGFVNFNQAKGKYDTRMVIGNYARMMPGDKTTVISRPLNTHYSGYMPTILLLALTLATPFSWKRKSFSLLSGLVLLTLFIVFKQWIHILFLCLHNPWIQLYNFSTTQKQIIEYLYPKTVEFIGTSWFMVVVIWLLVSFRKNDLETIA